MGDEWSSDGRHSSPNPRHPQEVCPETSVKSVKRRESPDVRSRDDALQSNFCQVGRGLPKTLKNRKLDTENSEAEFLAAFAALGSHGRQFFRLWAEVTRVYGGPEA